MWFTVTPAENGALTRKGPNNGLCSDRHSVGQLGVPVSIGHFAGPAIVGLEGVMFKMAVGYSEDVDEHDAIVEALDMAVGHLGDLTPAAGVLFAGHDYDHRALVSEIMARFPEIKLIGCVADGQMSSESGYADDGVTLTLFASDVITFSAGIGDKVSADPLLATRRAAEQALAGSDGTPALAIVFPDLLQSDLGAVVEALRSVLGASVPIVGGASAAEDLRANPWVSHQFFNDSVHTDSLPLLLLFGPLKFSASIAHGWSPMGKPATVTRSERNKVALVGEQTIMDYYRGYIGDDVASLWANPLAVSQDQGGFILRAVIGTDDAAGTASFMGEVPVGSTVRVSMATVPDILDAAARSVGDAMASFPGPGRPEGALLVSCAMRRMLLGTRAAEEVARFRTRLGSDVPMIGFYAWAEIGPLADGVSRLHNATFVTVLLGT